MLCRYGLSNKPEFNNHITMFQKPCSSRIDQGNYSAGQPIITVMKEAIEFLSLAFTENVKMPGICFPKLYKAAHEMMRSEAINLGLVKQSSSFCHYGPECKEVSLALVEAVSLCKVFLFTNFNRMFDLKHRQDLKGRSHKVFLSKWQSYLLSIYYSSVSTKHWCIQVFRSVSWPFECIQRFLSSTVCRGEYTHTRLTYASHLVFQATYASCRINCSASFCIKLLYSSITHVMMIEYT